MAAWSSATASAISLGVRWRTKTGLPRHLIDAVEPSSTLDRSYSTEARARVSADGFIWSTKGHTVATAPTPTVAIAAMWMKSRRLASSPGWAL